MERSEPCKDTMTLVFDLHTSTSSPAVITPSDSSIAGRYLATIDLNRLPLSYQHETALRPHPTSTKSTKKNTTPSGPWRATTRDSATGVCIRRALARDVKRGVLICADRDASTRTTTQTSVEDCCYYLVTVQNRYLQIRRLPAPSQVELLSNSANECSGRAVYIGAESASPIGDIASTSLPHSGTLKEARLPTPTLQRRSDPPTDFPSTAIRSAAGGGGAGVGTNTVLATTEARKNALKRMIVTSLKLRSIDKSNAEFKDLYNHTLQAATFALRRLDNARDQERPGSAGSGSLSTKEKNALWERKAVVHVENLLQMFLS